MKLTKMLELRTGEKGAVMVEYALLAALIAVFLIAAITIMRNQIAAVFNAIAAAL